MEINKKLLLISPFARPNIGGVEAHLEKLTKYAISKGYYVVIITYQPLTTKTSGPKFEKGEDFEIHRVSWFGQGWFPKVEKYFPLSFLYLFPGLFIKTLSYYSKHRKEISVIHAHGIASAAIVRILNMLFPKKRSIVSTHAIYNLVNRPLLAKIFKFTLSDFDKVLAVSEVSKNELIGIGLNSQKVAVHPNWIPTDKFLAPTQIDTSLLLDSSHRFNVLFIGRLLETKGIGLILETAKHLQEVGFHIVGNGPKEDEVRQQASHSSNLFYYGVLNQNNPDDFNKIINLYAYCNYLVSPYLYDEGFSTVLIEALSCGTKLIVTKRGSPPTFLSDQTALYLNPNPTSEELTELLSKLYKENVPKSNYSTICRDFAIKNFSPLNADIIINSYTSDL